jgi:uncharacterized protein YbjT (DUF2867 family)
MDSSGSTMESLASDGHGEPMTTLIIGGTGKTGRRVADRLAALDHPVRAVSRSTDPRFDWNDPRTWAPALEGCTSAYVTYQPDLALPGADDVLAELAAIAVAQGANRLVLLSGRGEEGAQLSEERLIDSGAAWTVVRCAFFAQNFSEGLWTESVTAGELTLPGNTAEPFLDLEDVADVVVAALTDDRHIGEVYECTGPRLLTFDEAMKEVGVAVGHDVAFREVSRDEFAAGLVEDGLPEVDAEGLADMFVHILDGHNAYLADGVRRALGREARDFTDFVRRTAEEGVWHG